MESRLVSVIITLVAVTLTLVVLNNLLNLSGNNFKTEAAILSTVDDSATVDAVFVRDETIVKNTSGGVVLYKVGDADKLAVGDVIADVYASDKDVDSEHQIDELQKRLDELELVQNPGTSLSAEPSVISEKINDIYRTMLHNRSANDISSVIAEKSELNTLFSTYRILTDDNVDFLKEIASLNAQIAELKAKQDEPINTIKASKSAYFISFADGYESKLTTSKIDKMTAKDIENVKDTGALEDDSVVGKLVNSYKWYAVGVLPDNSVSYETGDDITIKFSSTNETAQGTVESIRTDGKGNTIITVSSNVFKSDFVQHRKEKIQLIKAEYTGAKVPREALRFNNVEVKETDEHGNESTKTENVIGVFTLTGNRAEFKRVNILYEGDDFVITEVGDGSDYLDLYDQVITDGADGKAVETVEVTTEAASKAEATTIGWSFDTAP